MENLFSHYEKAFRNRLDSQNNEIIKIYNESNKTDEKLDNLSYNEYRRSGTDYFDVTKKYYHTLLSNLKEQVDMQMKLRKYNDQISLENIMLDTLKGFSKVCETHSNIIFERLFAIEKKNKAVINYEENYLKMVDNYFNYLNFAYFAKDSSQTNFDLLQKILKQYKGNVSHINLLLNKYGYINKQRALVI